MAKVVSSHTSALPNCILPRAMVLVSPLDLRSSGDTIPMTLLRIQLGRADMRIIYKYYRYKRDQYVFYICCDHNYYSNG